MGKGKRISAEDKQTLVDLVREEIELHKWGKIERLSTNKEVGEMCDITEVPVWVYLKRNISKEDLNYRKKAIISYTTRITLQNPAHMEALKQRSRQNMIRLNQRSEFMEANIQRLIKLNQDSEFKKRNRENRKQNMIKLHQLPEIRELYKQNMIRLNQRPEFREANIERARQRLIKLNQDPKFRESNIQRLIKLNQDPKFRESNIQRGIKTYDSLRKNSYNVEGRFFSSSMQEGAVALMLEKYIPEYQIKEGGTFQVRDKGINNGGIDFLVNDEFLEWHPIILSNGTRGDIPKNLSQSYSIINNVLEGEKKAKFQKNAKNILAGRYQRLRQESVDKSGYAGTHVALATNPKELYEFISKYNDNLPNYDEFRREFNDSVESMRKYRVNSLEEAVKVV